nr:reverse transcriptase [Tanacetum cinerariifolium]
MVPPTNTQSVSNESIPNVNVARFHSLLDGCKTVFLNGNLKEEVYVGQPPGFVSKQYTNHVHALDKALYGFKQAPRIWYDVFSKFLIDSGFQKDLMVKRFEMSMMEEMKLFLGL